MISREVPLFDFDVSMGLFKRCDSKENVPLMLENDNDELLEAGCGLNCLQNCLKNVKIQFELMELGSPEVYRAKFSVENCMVLSVVQIDEGNSNFLRHVNWIVERWRADAVKRREQKEMIQMKRAHRKWGS